MSQSPSLRGSGRFRLVRPIAVKLFQSLNPLHCGAVVASLTGVDVQRIGNVSIPFIAGQWSLQDIDLAVLAVEDQFQSPSLRGSGRFFNRC